MARCPDPRRLALPLCATTAGLTAAHHGFELATGIGLVGQPELGLPTTSLLWGIGLPAWALLAGRGRPRASGLLALACGTALAGSLVHFLMWPTRRGRLGLPVLAEAEGLPPASLPAYNTILYAWGAAAALSILLEVPRGSRRWSLVGLATIPLQIVSARHHFAWIAEQAAERPAWWNRAVRRSAG